MKKKLFCGFVACLLLFLNPFFLFSCGTKEVTVKFQHNDGTAQIDEQIVEKNGLIAEPPIPQRHGYQFDGWYLDDTQWDFQTPVKKNTLLKARWIAKTYTISFDPNGGECAVTEVKVTYGSPVQIPDPVREGYIFLGWYDTEKMSGVLPEIWDKNLEKSYIARWLPCSPGSVTYFGSYEQDNNFENGPEPIEWFIIDEKDGKYLLLSRYALEGMAFVDSNDYIPYQDSLIRGWLNGTFYSSAFTDEEKNLISSAYLPDAGTTDKVFLMSKTDSALLRQITEGNCYPTKYAKESGRLDTYYNDFTFKTYCFWWVRDVKREYSSRASYCSMDDFSGWSSTNSGRIPNGVRPLIWVEGTALTIVEKPPELR